MIGDLHFEDSDAYGKMRFDREMRATKEAMKKKFGDSYRRIIENLSESHFKIDDNSLNTFRYNHPDSTGWEDKKKDPSSLIFQYYGENKFSHEWYILETKEPLAETNFQYLADMFVVSVGKQDNLLDTLWYERYENPFLTPRNIKDHEIPKEIRSDPAYKKEIKDITKEIDEKYFKEKLNLTLYNPAHDITLDLSQKDVIRLILFYDRDKKLNDLIDENDKEDSRIGQLKESITIHYKDKNKEKELREWINKYADGGKDISDLIEMNMRLKNEVIENEMKMLEFKYKMIEFDTKLLQGKLKLKQLEEGK